MSALFETIKDKVLASVVNREEREEEKNLEYLISLGVLLWIVAEADEQFLPAEEAQINEVLKDYGDINDKDMPVLLRTIEEANIMRIDVQSFTRDIRDHLDRDDRLDILDHLFHVACADKELDIKEHEVIRKIADLLGLDHSEFVDSKIKIKKKFGLETVE